MPISFIGVVGIKLNILELVKFIILYEKDENFNKQLDKICCSYTGLHIDELLKSLPVVKSDRPELLKSPDFLHDESYKILLDKLTAKIISSVQFVGNFNFNKEYGLDESNLELCIYEITHDVDNRYCFVIGEEIVKMEISDTSFSLDEEIHLEKIKTSVDLFMRNTIKEEDLVSKKNTIDSFYYCMLKDKKLEFFTIQDDYYS
jgi:hypothetical protein